MYLWGGKGLWGLWAQYQLSSLFPHLTDRDGKNKLSLEDSSGTKSVRRKDRSNTVITRSLLSGHQNLNEEIFSIFRYLTKSAPFYFLLVMLIFTISFYRMLFFSYSTCGRGGGGHFIDRRACAHQHFCWRENSGSSCVSNIANRCIFSSACYDGSL